nr:MAG TPA: hypothetical protein [Caudoviricetes sp.]
MILKFSYSKQNLLILYFINPYISMIYNNFAK